MKRSSSGALLVFSTEKNDIEDFFVRESGRIAHSTRYIQTVTETFNIKIFAEKRLPIRKDHAKWIEGDLFICELP
jgi:predicted TPR repeat methyltransferase